jgi:hypothetical protein
MPRTRPKPCDPPRHPARPRRAARRTIFQYDLFGAHRVINRPFDARRLAQIAEGIWRASIPVHGTLGERLFRALRVKVPDADTARFNALLKHGDERSPAVIFLLRDERTNEPTGVVRIFLDEFGWAVERRILGRRDGATLNPAPRPP